LKRAFTHKVESVPSCAADNDALAKLSGSKLPEEVAGYVKPISPEVNRRVRTSAAMIGLAISMGASSLLLPRQGDEAMAAAEPVAAEPTLTTPTTPEVGVVSPLFKQEPLAALSNPQFQAAESKTKVSKPAPTVIEQKVQPEQSLRQVSPTSKVDAAAIATSNNFKSSSVLPIGKSVNTLGNANELLNGSQDNASDRLKQQRNPWENGLAELRSEESTNISEQVNLGTGVVPQPIQQSAVVTPAGEIEQSVLTQLEKARSISSPVLSPTASQKTAPLAATSPVIHSSQKSAVSATSAVPNSPVVKPQEAAAPTRLYQVKSGDTLDAIAQAYGVSPTAMIRVNQINNPNQIKVNQEVKIPPSQSISLIPGIKPETGGSTLSTSQPSVAAPGPAVAPLSTNVIPANLKQQLSDTKPATTTASLASTLVRTALPKSTLLVASAPSQSLNSKPASQDNPYIEKLRGEVLKLQEQYPAQNKRSQANSAVQAAPRAVASLAPTPLNSTKPQPQVLAQSLGVGSTPSAVPIAVPTPLFNNSKPRQQSKPQNQGGQVNSAVQPGSASVPIAVPTPPRQDGVANLGGQTAAGAVMIPVPPPQMATAPIGTDAYNPITQPPLGQEVNPDLPPLQGPGQYLPPTNLPQFTGYIWPAKGVFTSGFGRRWGRMHAGIDVAAPVGTPIYAVAPGVVVRSGWNSGGYGNLVDIRHPDGTLTRYGHNSRLMVKAGQQVEQGEKIAEMGSTGNSTGPHLHFEIHLQGKKAVNPVAYLPRRNS
jgi:murein DD-endopeptidase MepM/ murein hydrolase activator NlpD